MTSSIAQSIQPSYDALHRTAAVFDRTSTDSRLLVSGPDRIEWLQGLLTNDIAALTPGGGCYAAYLTPQGRMLGDMRVLHLGATVLLDVVAEARETLLSRLDQFIIMEEVTLADASDDLGCVMVAGPTASDVLSGLLSVERTALEALTEHHHLAVSYAGADGWCAATHDTGDGGFDVYLPIATSSAFLQALTDAGVSPLGPNEALTARVEAGRPRFGVDMDDDTIPLEAGIEGRAISFTKGCYVGQEVVIRVLHRGKGRVARRLCWVVADRSPEGADRDVSADVWVPGADVRLRDKVVGSLTSACWSPARGQWLAMALLHRDAFEPGTAIDVVKGDAIVPAIVERLPS